MIDSYSHSQKGPWALVLDAFGVGMLLFAALTSEPTPARLLLTGVGVLMLVLASAFRELTVLDLGDRLGIRFGPLPLFRTSIPYADIHRVEVSRTSLLDGWGIHLSLRGGWVWNIGGFDCVAIHHRRGTLWLGTDDPQNLAAFLANRASLASS